MLLSTPAGCGTIFMAITLSRSGSCQRRSPGPTSSRRRASCVALPSVSRLRSVARLTECWEATTGRHQAQRARDARGLAGTACGPRSKPRRPGGGRDRSLSGGWRDVWPARGGEQDGSGYRNGYANEPRVLGLSYGGPHAKAGAGWALSRLGLRAARAARAGVISIVADLLSRSATGGDRWVDRSGTSMSLTSDQSQRAPRPHVVRAPVVRRSEAVATMAHTSATPSPCGRRPSSASGGSSTWCGRSRCSALRMSGARCFGPRRPVAVGLRDHHQVGQLHDPALDPLQVVPVAGGEASGTNMVDRSATATSLWPTPTVSTKITSKPAPRRASAPSGPPGHPAQPAAG